MKIFLIILIFFSYGYANSTEKYIVNECNSLSFLITNELKNYPYSIFDVDLICSLIFIESSFKPDAISERQAVGLMQITPIAWKHYILENDHIEKNDRIKVEQNIQIGIWYLHYLYNHFHKEDFFMHIILSSYWKGLGDIKKNKIKETIYSKKVMDTYWKLKVFKMIYSKPCKI